MPQVKKPDDLQLIANHPVSCIPDDRLASAAFGKITAVYVPVGCLNYVHFDDMGRHMSVSIEHFFWTCSAFNEKRRMFTKSIAV